MSQITEKRRKMFKHSLLILMYKKYAIIKTNQILAMQFTLYRPIVCSDAHFRLQTEGSFCLYMYMYIYILTWIIFMEKSTLFQGNKFEFRREYIFICPLNSHRVSYVLTCVNKAVLYQDVMVNGNIWAYFSCFSRIAPSFRS